MIPTPKQRHTRYASVPHEPARCLSELNNPHPLLAVWSTGQDQAAIIKRNLQRLIPHCKIFLDVDDLEDVSRLEEYVAQTSVILLYCSGGYFRSATRPFALT